uniref:Acb2/Tad1 hairpin domain-containing protein n=1 Tax=Streptomyces phage Scarif TaxID=3158858 RepID=A0AAU7GZV2_9CAUD
MLGEQEIQNRFGFHKATIEGDGATKPKHADIRHAFVDFAEYLDEVLLDGRYKNLAMTELENASMWSHKSVAETAPLVDEN